MDPRYIQHDSRTSREIHSALLDISKIFGQAALNMMRERNAQTQDALHPTRKKQAGKSLPPPLEIYSKQKKFLKKTKKQIPVARITTRVTSMHPPFVRDPRKHPRVLGQEYRRSLELQAAATAAAAAIIRATQQATVYSEEFPIPEPIVPPPWALLLIVAVDRRC